MVNILIRSRSKTYGQYYMIAAVLYGMVVSVHKFLFIYYFTIVKRWYYVFFFFQNHCSHLGTALIPAHGQSYFTKHCIFSSPGHRPCELLPSLGFVVVIVVVVNILCKHLLLWNYWTEFIETWHDYTLGCPSQKSCLDFLSFEKTWQLLLKVEHRGQSEVFHIYLQIGLVNPNSDRAKILSTKRSICGQVF